MRAGNRWPMLPRGRKLIDAGLFSRQYRYRGVAVEVHRTPDRGWRVEVRAGDLVIMSCRNTAGRVSGEVRRLVELAQEYGNG